MRISGRAQLPSKYVRMQGCSYTPMWVGNCGGGQWRTPSMGRGALDIPGPPLSQSSAACTTSPKNWISITY